LRTSDWAEFYQTFHYTDTLSPPNHLSIHLSQTVTLKMEAEYSSETVEQTGHTAWCKTPKRRPSFEQQLL